MTLKMSETEKNVQDINKMFSFSKKMNKMVIVSFDYRLLIV